MKNLRTGDIRQVLDIPVDILQTRDDDLFAVIGGTQIVQASESDIYSPFLLHDNSGVIISRLVTHEDELYFIDESGVKRINLTSHQVETLLNDTTVTYIYPLDQNTFHWRSADGGSYVLDLKTQQTRELLSEIEVGALYTAYASGTATASTDIADNTVSTCTISLDSVGNVHPTVRFPLTDYPVGSYYNDTHNGSEEGPCEHHNITPCDFYGGCECTSYDNSIQCMGFAKFASDQFANRTSFSRPTGDCIGETNIGTQDLASAFFCSLTAGAYVRLNNQHSVVVVSADSDSVTFYECNYGKPCRVSTRTVAYDDLITEYRVVNEAVSHNYRVIPVSYSSDYHKYACTSTGCGGYLLERHYTSSPGNTATCEGCGYVGPIFGTATYAQPEESVPD